MNEASDTTQMLLGQGDDTPVLPGIVFWLAMLAMFGLLHVPHDMMVALFGSHAAKVLLLPVRRLLFLLALTLTALPFLMCAHHRRNLLGALVSKQEAVNAFAVFGLVGCLVYAVDSPHLCRDMGFYYARISDAPFLVEFGPYHRRLLKPVLAHLLLLRGQFLYFVFSMALTYGVILMMLVLHRSLGHRGTLGSSESSNSMPLLWAVSLGTCSFIAYDFANPGYPDGLVFFLVLAALVIRPGPQASLSVLALCLATHEASVFILVPLILSTGHRRLWLPFAAMVGLYGLGWACCAGIHAEGVSDHTSIFGASPLQHLVAHPWSAFLGAFFSYKLLWCIPFLCTLSLRRKIPWRKQAGWFAIFLAPLGLIPIAFDTSRLAGWGFVGLIFFLAPLHARAQKCRPLLLLMHVLFALNLMLPSMVCYARGPWYPRGLYGLAVDILAPPAVKQYLWNR